MCRLTHCVVSVCQIYVADPVYIYIYIYTYFHLWDISLVQRQKNLVMTIRGGLMQVRVCMCMCECGECTWYEGVCTPEPDGLMGGVIARVWMATWHGWRPHK